MELKIDFDKLSEKRRKTVLDALFSDVEELQKKYEEVIDKMVTERNRNGDCTFLEAQEKIYKIYNDNEALIDEHDELERLMEEISKENQK